jgi:hypothetical protein
VVKAFLSRFLDSRFLDREPAVHSSLPPLNKGAIVFSEQQFHCEAETKKKESGAKLVIYP